MRKAVYLFILICITHTALFAVPVKHPAVHEIYSDSSLVLIPFEYKQSALYHAFTFEVIDSVVNLLLKNDSITLTINGYSHPDEGSDTICKYLALNRALFVRDYILGRGVKDARIVLVRGMSSTRSDRSNVNADGHAVNCKVELMLNFPPPPPPIIYDRDEDGIADSVDACADTFGYAANNGCPDKNFILIPFDMQQAWLSPATYKAMDSVVALLKENASASIIIQGHAYKQEGIASVCERLAAERAAIVKKYFLSRNIAERRITAVESYGAARPLNGAKNPQEALLNVRAQLFIRQ
jgi:outer membrane protein OmpA-like peptidoglycan-associated protein